MRTLTTSNGKTVFVDDADFEGVSSHIWTAVRYKHTWYAIRNICRGHKTLRHVFMHRQILQLAPDDGVQVDHWDRNGLNNQRANLRKATGTQNNANREKMRPGTSRFKGVYLDKRRGTWQAGLKINRRKVYLGAFDSEEAAAIAYNRGALEAFGEFARLNVISPLACE